MRVRIALAVVALAAAFVSTAAWGREPRADAASGTPVTPGAARTRVACRLLTAADIRAVAGVDVSHGEPLGAAPDGCRWRLHGADPRSVTVLVVGREAWEDGAGAPGGERLPGPGECAFVGPWLDDQRAGALAPGAGVYVLSPRRELSVSLLSRAFARVLSPPPN